MISRVHRRRSVGPVIASPVSSEKLSGAGGGGCAAARRSPSSRQLLGELRVAAGLLDTDDARQRRGVSAAGNGGGTTMASAPGASASAAAARMPTGRPTSAPANTGAPSAGWTIRCTTPIHCLRESCRPTRSCGFRGRVQIPWRLRHRNLLQRKLICPALPFVAAFSPPDQCRWSVPPRLVPLPERHAVGYGHGAVRSATRSIIARVHEPPDGVGAAGGRPCRRCFRPCPRRPGAHRPRPQDRRTVARRHRGHVPRRGAGPGEGAHRAGRAVRRPRGHHVPHPLRVDALRLRPVEHRRPGRAGVPDLLGRAGPVDAARRPGVRRDGRARGPRHDDRLGRRPAAAAAPVVAAGRRRGR